MVQKLLISNNQLYSFSCDTLDLVYLEQMLSSEQLSSSQIHLHSFHLSFIQGQFKRSLAVGFIQFSSQLHPGPVQEISSSQIHLVFILASSRASSRDLQQLDSFSFHLSSIQGQFKRSLAVRFIYIVFILTSSRVSSRDLYQLDSFTQFSSQLHAGPVQEISSSQIHLVSILALFKVSSRDHQDFIIHTHEFKYRNIMYCMCYKFNFYRIFSKIEQSIKTHNCMCLAVSFFNISFIKKKH